MFDFDSDAGVVLAGQSDLVACETCVHSVWRLSDSVDAEVDVAETEAEAEDLRNADMRHCEPHFVRLLGSLHTRGQTMQVARYLVEVEMGDVRAADHLL